MIQPADWWRDGTALGSRGSGVVRWFGCDATGPLPAAAVRPSPAARLAGPAAPSNSSPSSAPLAAILGYSPESKVGIDYVPSYGDWKLAWDRIVFEGFGGAQMTLELTWRGSDTALAAPLCIDLIRLVELAQRRGDTAHRDEPAGPGVHARPHHGERHGHRQRKRRPNANTQGSRNAARPAQARRREP